MLGIMESFEQRKEKILSVFTQAKSDLEQMNLDIDEKVKSNLAQIEALQIETQGLLQMKANNEASIKGFTKFIK